MSFPTQMEINLRKTALCYYFAEILSTGLAMLLTFRFRKPNENKLDPLKNQIFFVIFYCLLISQGKKNSAFFFFLMFISQKGVFSPL